MKKIIHVNQHIIKSNKKNDKLDPPITVKTYKSNGKANEVKIVYNGVVVASVVYQPQKPLSCGAHVWIETECDIELH